MLATTAFVTAAISDTDYTPPINNVEVSGSGTFVNSTGSSTTYTWFNDPLNNQGAENTG